jgi:hypothetical protein
MAAAGIDFALAFVFGVVVSVGLLALAGEDVDDLEGSELAALVCLCGIVAQALEPAAGRTVGKMATGLWIRRKDGAPAGWGRLLARFAVKNVWLLCFAAAFAADASGPMETGPPAEPAPFYGHGIAERESLHSLQEEAETPPAVVLFGVLGLILMLSSTSAFGHWRRSFHDVVAGTDVFAEDARA